MENVVPEKQSTFATEPIGRLILKYAVPSVIALLVNSLYNIVDQIFIGWGVGYLSNGTTNVVFPIIIIALALSMMIGNGVASHLSLKQCEGEKKADCEEAPIQVLSPLRMVFLLCEDHFIAHDLQRTRQTIVHLLYPFSAFRCSVILYTCFICSMSVSSHFPMIVVKVRFAKPE